MVRILAVLMCGAMALGACAPAPVTSNGSAQQVYRLNRGNASQVQFRMLDAVNTLRSASGRKPVKLNARLNAAAATHSRDMSIQNRPWHFGSDGSSPIDRVKRVGYVGELVGENISETYETELETLAAWMDQPDTRRTILARDAIDMGFSWHQETNGKIWWTLVMGNPNVRPIVPAPNPSSALGT